MRKLSSILFLCLLFLLFSSCERPDLTEDVELAYDRAVDLAGDRVCSEFYGDGECNGHNVSACVQEDETWYEVEGTDIKFYCEDGDCSDAADDLFDYCYSDSSDYGDTSSDYGDTSSDSSSGSCPTIDGYMWSPLSSDTMYWDDAVVYCHNLTECGYSDWRLPTISELRTLIKNCSGTVTGGSCGVTDSCLSSSCWDEDSCWSCSYDDDSGKYSRLGDDGNVWLWSSSTQSDRPDYAWFVSFKNGSVNGRYKTNGNDVRCVR